MGNAIEVFDNLANVPEQKEQVARVVGNGNRRKVFEAIYYHKQKVKSVSEIAKRSRLGRKQVLNEARVLYKKGVVKSAPKKDGELAYGMYERIHAHKSEILKLIDNPKRLAGMATKRRPAINVNVKVSGARAGKSARPVTKELTIDDIDSFKKVRKIKPDGNLPKSVSETTFKLGIQALLGDVGEWKDWGGENYDFSTTRLTYKGRRIRSVFAFKGPGHPGALTPSRMGANGDQVARMFFEDARLYVVQHWRDIKPAMWTEVKAHAVTKADATGETIYYLIMEGVDSHRIYRAYPAAFAVAAKSGVRAKAKKSRRNPAGRRP